MGKRNKGTPEWKKRRLRFTIWTMVTLLIFTGIVLGVCAWYWKWTWEMVTYYLNPMNNQITLLVYIAIAVFLMALIWLIHRYNDEKDI